MTAIASRYIRETSLIVAQAVLSLPDSSRVRRVSQREADEMAAAIRKRSVFSRHSWENDFYYQRALSFAGKTIIEVFRPGQPNDIARDAEVTSELIEMLVLLSTTPAAQRDVFMRKLGIGTRQQTEFDLILGPDLRYLRSRTRTAAKRTGFPLDRTAVARFQRLGFPLLYNASRAKSPLGARLHRSLSWLFESRREPNLEAAIVKTAIALETLLVFGESEPVTRSLSERAAFLLSPKPDTRKRVAALVSRLYEARSGVVHGGKRKRKSVSPRLLEGGDRLAVLLLLVVSGNTSTWPDEDAFRSWLQDERWRAPTRITLPFAPVYLSRALAFSERS